MYAKHTHKTVSTLSLSPAIYAAAESARARVYSCKMYIQITQSIAHGRARAAAPAGSRATHATAERKRAGALNAAGFSDTQRTTIMYAFATTADTKHQHTTSPAIYYVYTNLIKTLRRPPKRKTYTAASQSSQQPTPAAQNAAATTRIQYKHGEQRARRPGAI